jgi:hypothetical protein
MNIFRRDDHREGEGHAGVTEGIAEREEARARTSYLMQALNVEDNTKGLRYDKVILATDAGRGRHAHPQSDDYLFLQVL